MSSWKHRLTNINSQTRTAICSNCGEDKVKLRKRLNGYISWRCRTIVNIENKKSPSYSYKAKTCTEHFCRICKTETKLVWDHDHVTGKFRGWLCSPCNIGLGMFKDDANRLEEAIKYLKK